MRSKSINKPGRTPLRAALLAGATVLAVAAGGGVAKANTLHGFCFGSATCSDNSTNTPTSVNPPDFGFP